MSKQIRKAATRSRDVPVRLLTPCPHGFVLEIMLCEQSCSGLYQPGPVEVLRRASALKSMHLRSMLPSEKISLFHSVVGECIFAVRVRRSRDAAAREYADHAIQCAQALLASRHQLPILLYMHAGEEGKRCRARVRGARCAAGGGAPAGCQGARQAGAACIPSFSAALMDVKWFAIPTFGWLNLWILW